MDQRPLARNLRVWRERVRPEAVGLPGTPRRRTPGLRREELWPSLAGLSAEYIVRLEQGRAAHPSPQVLSAIARALRLSAAETDHIFHLAGVASPDERFVPRRITPGVMRIVDRLSKSPPSRSAPRPGRPSTGTRCGPPSWATRERSRTRAQLGPGRFTGLPTQISHTADALAEFEHDMVCDLRRTLDCYPAERDLAQMCQALKEQNENFARLWDSGDVARHRAVRKTVNHLLVGPITVDCDVLTTPAAPSCMSSCSLWSPVLRTPPAWTCSGSWGRSPSPGRLRRGQTVAFTPE